MKNKVLYIYNHFSHFSKIKSYLMLEQAQEFCPCLLHKQVLNMSMLLRMPTLQFMQERSLPIMVLVIASLYWREELKKFNSPLKRSISSFLSGWDTSCSMNQCLIVCWWQEISFLPQMVTCFQTRQPCTSQPLRMMSTESLKSISGMIVINSKG